MVSADIVYNPLNTIYQQISNVGECLGSNSLEPVWHEDTIGPDTLFDAY